MTGEAPLVDQESSAIGNNIDSRQIKSLPSGRNYTSIVQISPGVSTQTANTAAFANSIVVNGSTGLENSFVIDGVVTSGVEYGAQGKELNYEFIQELEVKTGGYQAEFGRSTGGIINVITKSGGNEFHGEAFVYYEQQLAPGLQQAPRGLGALLLHLGLQPARLRLRPRRLRPEGQRSGSSAPTTACRTRRSRR